MTVAEYGTKFAGGFHMPVFIPVAYTYEADIHCPDCTEMRFGRNKDGYIALTDNGAAIEDNEGNGVGAIFIWDEYHEEWCGDCGVEIR